MNGLLALLAALVDRFETDPEKAASVQIFRDFLSRLRRCDRASAITLGTAFTRFS